MTPEETRSLSAPVPSPDPFAGTQTGPGNAGQSVTLPHHMQPSPHLPDMPPGYAITGELGRGGMGVVYAAVDTRLKREVALKMLLVGGEERRLRRFLIEAEAMAQVRHPHVVQVFEAGEHRGQPFLALEYLPGGTLAARLARGRLPLREALTLIVKIARGVEAAHREGIVHRDLKPGNVMFDGHGEPKVTDFGLAKRGAQDLTATEATMGTPAYMAPEQAKGETKHAGPAADVYSLGVLLYEMTTGTRPFVGESAAAIIHKVINDPPEPPRRREPSLPADVQTICLKCLEKEPSHRYATAGELADDLGRFLDGLPIAARTAGLAERAAKWVRRNPARATAYALTLAVVLLSGFGASLAALWRTAVGAKETAENARVEAEIAKNAAVIARAQEEDSRRRLAVVEYGRTIALAYQEWRDGNLGEAKRLLASTDPERRGWEWHYVHRLCHSEALAIPPGAKSFNQLQLSRSGTLDVLAVGLPKTVADVESFDLLTGKKTVSTTGRDCLAMNRDFSLGVTRDGEVFETAGNKSVCRLQGWKEYDYRPVFSPDGSLVANANGKARVWNARSGVMTAEVGGDLSMFDSAAFSPDGKRLLTGGRRQTSLWNLDAKPPVAVPVKHEEATAFAFSPDGSRMATGGQDGRVCVWDVKTVAITRIFTGHSEAISAVEFSPDGRRITAAGADGVARLWETESGYLLRTLRTHEGGVMTVRFAPDGRRLVTMGRDGFIRVWDPGMEIEARELDARRPLAGIFATVAISPDSSSLFAAGTGIPSAQMWDTEAGVRRFSLTASSGLNIRCASGHFSRDGSRLVTTAYRKTVWIWDARDGSQLSAFDSPSESLVNAAFDQSGDRFVSAGEDGIARICDSRTGREIHRLAGHEGAVYSVAFSPDDTLVATGGSDLTLRIWDAQRGVELTRLDFEQAGGFTSLAFRPDGRRLAVRRGRMFRVYDVATWKPVFSIETADRDTSSTTAHGLGYSPDGRRLVTSGYGVRIWDAETGAELLALKTPRPVVSAGIGPDGLRIFAGSFDGMLRIWDARPVHTAVARETK